MLLLPCNVLDMLDVPSKYLELFVARRARLEDYINSPYSYENFSLLKILSEWSRQETSEVIEKWLRCDCEVKDQRKDCQRTTKVLGVDFRIETVTRCCTFHFEMDSNRVTLFIQTEWHSPWSSSMIISAPIMRIVSVHTGRHRASLSIKMPMRCTIAFDIKALMSFMKLKILHWSPYEELFV